MIWVMIVVTWLGTQNAGLGVQSVPGFTTPEKCLEAATHTMQVAANMFKQPGSVKAFCEQE
jgi:hypothetical protein